MLLKRESESAHRAVLCFDCEGLPCNRQHSSLHPRHIVSSLMLLTARTCQRLDEERECGCICGLCHLHSPLLEAACSGAARDYCGQLTFALVLGEILTFSCSTGSMSDLTAACS